MRASPDCEDAADRSKQKKAVCFLPVFFFPALTLLLPSFLLLLRVYFFFYPRHRIFIIGIFVILLLRFLPRLTCTSTLTFHSFVFVPLIFSILSLSLSLSLYMYVCSWSIPCTHILSLLLSMIFFLFLTFVSLTLVRSSFFFCCFLSLRAHTQDDNVSFFLRLLYLTHVTIILITFNNIQ